MLDPLNLLAGRAVATAIERLAQSALPDAPVVIDTRPRLRRRGRRMTASALRRLAHHLAPDPTP